MFPASHPTFKLSATISNDALCNHILCDTQYFVIWESVFCESNSSELIISYSFWYLRPFSTHFSVICDGCVMQWQHYVSANYLRMSWYHLMFFFDNYTIGFVTLIMCILRFVITHCVFSGIPMYIISEQHSVIFMTVTIFLLWIAQCIPETLQSRHHWAARTVCHAANLFNAARIPCERHLGSHQLCSALCGCQYVHF